MKYFAIEGIDGVGKTSVQRFLAEEIIGRGRQAFRVHDTTGTPQASRIYDIVTDSNYHLLARTKLDLFNAARRETLRVIQSKLKDGIYCIADRSWRSSVAYQAFGEGLDVDEVYQLASRAAWLKPDLTVILDAPIDLAHARIDKRGSKTSWFEEQDRDFFERVREGFLWQASKDQLPIVDATLSRFDVYKQVLTLAEPLLKG